jgi:hypothetical protein
MHAKFILEDQRELCLRSRHTWEDNIKMIFFIDCMDVDYIHLAQNRVQWRILVNMVMKLGFNKSRRIS